MKTLIMIALLSLLTIAKPLHIDEILTQRDSFKLDISVSYSNIQRANGVSLPYTYQTENGDFVSVPTYFGSAKSNQDYLNYSLSLRYGVTKDIEFFTSANLYSSNTHSTLSNFFDTNSNKGFNSLNFGVTYQLKSESETPSLLFGLSINALDRTRFRDMTLVSKFKSYRVFTTSFYTVDPVVFLLNASYGVNLKKEFEDTSLDNGDIFTLTPQVYFAVNPYTSLNWGVKYTYYSENKIDGKQISSKSSNVSFLMGMSYEFSAKTIFNINAEYLNANNITQNSISTTFSYKF